ncbi:MAG TPA: hypothetical protein VK588_04925, partial [Chitinophagaceae bacterium]|nr:hypothetical protein [Chitinophagaceae bacterium]
MEIEELVALVVPPADYQHRNGFNNIPLISKLTKDEKTQLEDALISKLTNESKVSIDTLIIETLAFLKSEKSLPILKQLLGASSNNLTRLKIAASIFEIGKENDMIDIAIGLVGKI